MNINRPGLKVNLCLFCCMFWTPLLFDEFIFIRPRCRVLSLFHLFFIISMYSHLVWDSSPDRSRKKMMEVNSDQPVADAIRRQATSSQAVDDAWNFLDKYGDVQHTDLDLVAIRHKVDRRILPFMFCCYFLQFIDKVMYNVSISNLYPDLANSRLQSTRESWVWKQTWTWRETILATAQVPFSLHPWWLKFQIVSVLLSSY